MLKSSRYGLKLWLTLATIIFLAPNSSADSSFNPMLGAFKRGRYDEAVKIFNQGDSNLRSNAKANYLAGYALLREHKFEEARPLLSKASRLGFSGYPRWEQTSELLEAIAKLNRLKPPYFEDIPNRKISKIHVFTKKTPWMQPILAALPLYLARAQEVFGTKLPTLNFYFFNNRNEFNEFYKLIFGQNVPTSWQNGTGNTNVVVFCEQDRTSKSLATGIYRTLGDILHEYGHAICTTIYGSNYLIDVPQWLNEGCADAIAAPYYAELMQSYDKRLKEAGLHKVPPTYEQLCQHLYEDPDIRYAFASLMVQDMVKRQGVGVVGKIIVKASQKQNFEEAIVDTIGEKSQVVYQRVLKKFWCTR